MKTAILGTAYGYSIDMLAPFLRSCHRAMPGADVFLFIDRDDDATAAEARKLCPTTQLIRPQDTTPRKWLNRFHRGRRRLSDMALVHGLKRCRKGGHAPCSDKYVTLAFGPAVARYLWYLDWYHQHAGDGYDQLLIADTRDVVFQFDPFSGGLDQPIFTGIEAITMGSSKVNRDWYVQAFGEEKYDEIKPHLVLCSGVTGGEFGAMGEYLEAFVQLTLDCGHRVVRGNGYDQALHNYLLRYTPIGERVALCDALSPRLITLHYLGEQAFRIDEGNLIKNAAGALIAIVHQYDRHAGLVNVVSQFYGKVA